MLEQVDTFRALHFQHPILPLSHHSSQVNAVLALEQGQLEPEQPGQPGRLALELEVLPSQRT